MNAKEKDTKCNFKGVQFFLSLLERVLEHQIY